MRHCECGIIAVCFISNIAVRIQSKSMVVIAVIVVGVKHLDIEFQLR